MDKKALHTTLLVILLYFLSGCTTTKNTWMNRAYHNVTSKYNIFFNARQSLKSGEEKMERTIENDYTHLLPLFKDSDPSSAKAVESDMENVILKASKLIEVHSITSKPRRRRSGGSRRYQDFARKEEFNNWIDESYLIMGKAYFYLDNYLSAINNFSYVERKFPEEKTKYEAYLWLIRSYTQLERFTEASEYIQTAERDENFPRRLESDLAVVVADYCIKRGDYSEAIKYLDIAIQKLFWKKQKARLQYILAQLYEETGQPALASQAYARVEKFNPPYDMAFNAKIKAAGIYTGEGDAEKLKKELHKMLRDKKNIEFRDQIYYALGNIHFQEGDRNGAIQNYRKSVSSSIYNSYQLAQSAITLAGLYFEDLNYRDAQAYYDSAMIVIDDQYPDYENIEIRYNSLTRIVHQILVVEREDSLQKVASMSEDERNNLIDHLIDLEEQRQLQEQMGAVQGRSNSSFYRANQYRLGMGRTQMGSGWYFYNPQTVSFGKVQFQQRWGERKLEDDWRRTDKSTLAEGEFNEFEELIDSTLVEEPRIDDPLQREFYTQDLPMNDSLMALSHERIKDALYNAGKLFKTEFKNYTQSNAAYIELNRRYPDNLYTLASYFDLYDNYEILGNQERSDFYRNSIINRFPESKYARYLLNPNFFIDLEAQKDSINRLYQHTFERYKRGQYPQVISLTGQMKELEPDSVLMPKIDFLRSVSLGTQSEMPVFEKLLIDYIAAYPDEETSVLAGDILSLIQDSTLQDYQKLVEIGYLHDMIQNEEMLPGHNEEDEFDGKFSYDDDLLHYFVIAYPREASFDLNRLKFDIANYNIDHYTRTDFDMETENLDEQTALLVIRSLANKEQSLIYFRSIIRKKEVFQALGDVDYISLVASSTNYRALLADQSLTDYLSFFIKHYSRFTRPEFEDEELLETPEELMVKMEEEEEALEERGTFVMVSGTQPSGTFDASIDTTQCFILAIRGEEAPIRPVTSTFADFNRSSFRIWNLQLQLKSTGDYRLIVVKGLPGFNEALSYFRSAVTNRDLFTDLENISYRNFLITEENLRRLTENGKIDEYLDFFRQKYLQANVQESSQPEEGQASPTDTDTLPSTTLVSDPPEKPSQNTGPYHLETNKPHRFVLVIPSENIDRDTFVSGIIRYNETTAPEKKLTTEEQNLDSFRTIIVISGLQDKESAMDYFRQFVRERSLFEPLGEAEYRNFLITEENFDIFMAEKDLAEYLEFFRRFYLE